MRNKTNLQDVSQWIEDDALWRAHEEDAAWAEHDEDELYDLPAIRAQKGRPLRAGRRPQRPGCGSMTRLRHDTTHRE